MTVIRPASGPAISSAIFNCRVRYCPRHDSDSAVAVERGDVVQNGKGVKAFPALLAFQDRAAKRGNLDRHDGAGEVMQTQKAAAYPREQGPLPESHSISKSALTSESSR